MKKIYAVGVGGSGAKCLEAAIFLHALGIFGDSRLGTLLVDADYSNGNSQRTQINLRNTLDCYRIFKQGQNSPFMSATFKDYGVWNPLGDIVNENNLQQIFNKQLMKAQSPPLGKLFDALYSPDEQQADLKVGFRGRPPIGSIIMSRPNLENLTVTNVQGEIWQRLLEDIQADLGNGDEVSIHIFGSVFGGTGASGAPTLATLLSNYLKDKGLRSRVHLNASLLLPYFGFDRPQDGEQKVFAETRFFALNTQAALQFLTEHSGQVFDTVYLIGDEDKETYTSYTGGAQQQNQAHFVELYAALAIYDGFNQPIEKTQAAYISRANKQGLNWGDLPESEMVKSLLAKGVRFAYAWLYNFSLELESARELGAGKFAKGAPWLPRFFSINKASSELPSVSDQEQKTSSEILDKWTKSFLLWSQQIANSSRQEELLFRMRGLNINERNYQENLSALVIDGSKSPAEQSKDCLDTFKNKLADQKKQTSESSGVFGLAHALFKII